MRIGRTAHDVRKNVASAAMRMRSSVRPGMSKQKLSASCVAPGRFSDVVMRRT